MLRIFLTIVLVTMTSWISSCTSDVKDPKVFLSSGDANEGTTTPELPYETPTTRPVPYEPPTPTPSPTPTATGTGTPTSSPEPTSTALPGKGGTSVGDGVGGNCFEVPSIGRTCDADGSIFGSDQGVITVELLNFNNGEFIKGGGSYPIRYRSKITYEKFKSVYSKIEYKKQSESTWKLIVDRITSNDNEIVEYDWQVCPHPDVETCELGSDGVMVPVNGSDFQLRVTSFRLTNQSGTTTSSGSFTIDSAAPVLAEKQTSPAKHGFTLHLTQPTVPNGFVNLELYGASDNLSKIKKLCLKTSVTQPLEIDPCWISVDVYDAAQPSSLLTILKLPIFLGYMVKTNLTYYLWLKDTAGNISTLTDTVDGETTTYGTTEKDKLTISKAAVSYGDRNSFWQAGSAKPPSPDVSIGLNLNTGTSSSSVVRYKFANDDSSLADPGSLVITSAGVAYVKNSGPGASKGIYKIDLNSGAHSKLLDQGNHTVGLANGTTAKVNDPLRIALDDNEDLWIMDKKENSAVVISKVTGLSGSAPTMVDVIGGGTTTTSVDMSASNLQIDYSDNLRWYGTFAALPDGILVFSSEDPIKVLKPSSGVGFRLRAYRPERPSALQIQTLTLNTLDSEEAEVLTDAGNFLKNVEAYGVYGLSYDAEKRDISRIYGRGCSPTGAGVNKTCSEIVNIIFDRSGNFSSFMSVQGPWMWGNEVLMYTRQGNLVSMNAYRGRISTLVSASPTGNWIDQFADQGVGSTYCANGEISGQCSVRVKDFYITISGRIFFIDEQRLRFIDDDGTIQSILSF